MRRNIAPVREPVFEAHIELTQKDGRKLKLPIIFDKTTRPWAEFFRNLASQSATGAEAEIAEDLFSGISPAPLRILPGEVELFGGATPAAASSANQLSGWARHFMLMGG